MVTAVVTIIAGAMGTAVIIVATYSCDSRHRQNRSHGNNSSHNNNNITTVDIETTLDKETTVVTAKALVIVTIVY